MGKFDALYDAFEYMARQEAAKHGLEVIAISPSYEDKKHSGCQAAFATSANLAKTWNEHATYAEVLDSEIEGCANPRNLFLERIKEAIETEIKLKI